MSEKFLLTYKALLRYFKTVHTKKKGMEGLYQNKLLHDAVRFMVVELEGLNDFYKPDCACTVAFFQI